MPIEGSEDKYLPGTSAYAAWLEGRQYFIETGASDIEASYENPYQHQPHTKTEAAAWIDGVRDERLWALDSTGR